MNIIQFTSKLKPEGAEYKKVVYWNRFLRMKSETIILSAMFLLGIALIFINQDFLNLILATILIIFPIIVVSQFNNSIAYHLDNRDKVESMPCNYTVMTNGILVEVREEEYSKLYKWEDSTKVYDRLGYYMFFNHNEMTVMINKSDVSKDQLPALKNMIMTGMGKKKCMFK